MVKIKINVTTSKKKKKEGERQELFFLFLPYEDTAKKQPSARQEGDSHEEFNVPAHRS